MTPFDQPRCPICGCVMLLRVSDRFTYEKSGLPKKFWACVKWPECTANVGADPKGDPIADPADWETRRRRREVHELLERVQPTSRGRERWLRQRGFGDGHVGRMDRDACERAIRVLGGTLAPLVRWPDP